MPNKTRIDKWLWSIRIYKSRSISTDACKSGRVKVNGKSVKPSFIIEEGMIVNVNKKEKIWKVKALKIIEKRVASPIALTCYEDLSPPPVPSEKMPSFFYQSTEKRDKGTGRPTKKDRRNIDKFKGTE